MIEIFNIIGKNLSDHSYKFWKLKSRFFFFWPGPRLCINKYINTGPVQPVFLELFTVVAVEYFIYRYYIGGVHAPGPFRLAHWWANDVSYFGEQVKRMVGGVLDNPWIELF
jgi:hypothetical protein